MSQVAELRARLLPPAHPSLRVALRKVTTSDRDSKARDGTRGPPGEPTYIPTYGRQLATSPQPAAPRNGHMSVHLEPRYLTALFRRLRAGMPGVGLASRRRRRWQITGASPCDHTKAGGRARATTSPWRWDGWMGDRPPAFASLGLFAPRRIWWWELPLSGRVVETVYTKRGNGRCRAGDINRMGRNWKGWNGGFGRCAEAG
jgi:hypothetical protein